MQYFEKCALFNPSQFVFRPGLSNKKTVGDIVKGPEEERHSALTLCALSKPSSTVFRMKSCWRNLIMKVPQGSISGLMLVFIYINATPEIHRDY